MSVADIEAHEAEHGVVPEGAFVALLTGWADRWPDGDAMANRDADGLAHYPGWGVDALTFLVEERGVSAVGHDTTDTDPGAVVGAGSAPAETYILGADKWQIEMLAGLDRVPPTGALVVATWPKPHEGSGFPARVFAIVDRMDRVPVALPPRPLPRDAVRDPQPRAPSPPSPPPRDSWTAGISRRAPRPTTAGSRSSTRRTLQRPLLRPPRRHLSWRRRRPAAAARRPREHVERAVGASDPVRLLGKPDPHLRRRPRARRFTPQPSSSPPPPSSAANPHPPSHAPAQPCAMSTKRE